MWPQFDALFELLTGREHLQLYARIKGIVDDVSTTTVIGIAFSVSAVVTAIIMRQFTASGGCCEREDF